MPHALHPIRRRYLAEDLIRLRRADEERRFVASQRRGRIDPNPHQIDAVIFALRRIPDGGCILADEVGLGKTIEAGLVIAQLLAEGARRVLVIVPKPLLGQWREELFLLFSIETREGEATDAAFEGAGVFLVGRELAGSEKGSDTLHGADPFDLCVIDEAHEFFAGIYKRFDRSGQPIADAPHAQMAARVKGFLGDTPVMLLTATPMQNSLTELWGLVQYVEPTGTLLGNLRTFRQVFCDGDDRQLIEGQEHELRRRIATICQRTLRRQAQEFLERPFVKRRAQLFEYSMSPEEKALYDDVTTYLLQPGLAAFRGNHRRLLIISFHRQMASSVRALAKSLRGVAGRLRRMLERFDPELVDADAVALLDDLEEDVVVTDADEGEAPDTGHVREELALVESFAERAESLPNDSKAGALVRAVRIVLERKTKGAGSGKVLIFTESLATQAYLRELLLADGIPDGDITLFRGTNDGDRATEALGRWQAEVGEKIPSYTRPSRAVAVRLALVHEFRKRTPIFISTEAGAKGLNLQFCDTIVNYDLPWNPQRIEQRIGRCHRYSQTHDVTVINFLAKDNETQRLTFEILSQKLELFGTVLDASDVVLHETSTSTPETLVSAVAVEFEKRLGRIYERARTIDQIESELRELRESIGTEGAQLEAAAARTRSLIESRFDEKVRRVFRGIQDSLPQHLAELDEDLDRVLTGYLTAIDVEFVRTTTPGHIRFEIDPSDDLPDELADGLTVAIGPARDLADADPVHLGHPLVQAAIQEARAATERTFHVRFAIDDSVPPSLREHKGKRGRLVVLKVDTSGFEPVSRLIPMALLEGEDDALPAPDAAALLALRPHDVSPFEPPIDVDAEALEDAIEEILFVDQRAAADVEQERFDRAIEQIERFMEDQTVVLKHQRAKVARRLAAAEADRAAVMGAQARTRAENKTKALTDELEGLDAEISRLLRREDPAYERWRQRAHERRYATPSSERILDVEFVIE